MGDPDWAPGRAPILYVTGAPGAGKTTVVERLLRDPPGAILFDIDWLLRPASDLTGHSLVHARHLWPAYTRLWLEVLRSVGRNRTTAVLFSPLAPLEVAALAPAEDSEPGAWLLLDCDDATRAKRLEARGWTGAMIDEAIADGQGLREQVATIVDTSKRRPAGVAAEVRAWIDAHVARLGRRPVRRSPARLGPSGGDAGRRAGGPVKR